MCDRDLMETVTGETSIFDGVIVHLKRRTVTLPNGRPAAREVIFHPGASAIVPLDADGNVYLVRQWRTAVDRVTLELPAGKLDHGAEDPLTAAQRELSEETGFDARRWTHLTDLMTTPGFCNEVIHLYLAQDLTRGDVHPDADEFVHVVRMPLAEAVQKVYTGEITDAKTVSGLLIGTQHATLQRRE